MKEIGELRIAFIGASHWHVPLYLPAVEKEGLRVVAVSDADPACAGRVAKQLGCKAYTDGRTLMDAEKPDFIFAFDIHSKMPALAMEIISRGIPFSIEKPLGVSAQDVRGVREAAQRGGVFCAIPFIWRYSDLIRNLKSGVGPDEFTHFSFIFTAGPPSRYIKTSPWMLNAQTAGTGCMTNLGVHFIDMALMLTDSDSADVLGSAFHYVSGYDVEDYASTLVRLSGGATMTLQTAYAYPMDERNKRDNRWNFTTKNGYYTIGDGFVETRAFDKAPQTIYLSTDADVYYAIYTAETLKEYVSGRGPSAGLDDMLRTRIVLDDIIRKAKETPA